MKTRTFKLNKLVRDKIVENTEKLGGLVRYKILEGDKLTEELIIKLLEEAKELGEGEPSASELADLKEIIKVIADNYHITEKEIAIAGEKKRVENGSFQKGHFIESLTLPADNKWAKYYASDPQRFPEVKE